MKSLISKIVFLIIIIGVIVLVPVFNLKSGVGYAHKVYTTYKTSKSIAASQEYTQNSLDEAVKVLHQTRPSNAPHLDNPTELYNAVKGLPGVMAIQGQVINFVKGNGFVVEGNFNPNQQGQMVQGIQLSVQVKDLKPFIDALGKLDTPYASINVITVQKEVIIRYNTQGGMV